MAPRSMTSLLVRAGRVWIVTGVDGSRSEPLSVEAALARAGIAVAPGLVATAPAPAPSPPNHMVGVVYRTALVSAGEILVEGSEGRLVPIDPHDLIALDRLLDAGGHVIEGADPATLHRLHLAGYLAVAVPGAQQLVLPDLQEGSVSPEPAVGVIPTVAAAPSAPSPGPVRRWQGSADRGRALGARLLPRRRPVVPERIPVYAPWQEEHGPLLSLGMLLAAARAHDGGILNRSFDLRPMQRWDQVLAEVAGRPGPAILLCSNYIWSVGENLDLARAAKDRNPDLVIIHGGPSTPKYDEDAVRFLEQHRGIADILVHGEGEVTFCELLAALGPDLDLANPELRSTAGITYRSPVGAEPVRTSPRDRVQRLDDLPSPYLTGEFAHIDASAWISTGVIETNRGCPYGCTFCDWGSAINSRIRAFSDQRVQKELEWLGGRGIHALFVADANFGITSRDVATAETIASVHDRHGTPRIVSWMPAKNTTKHLTKIYDTFVQHGIGSYASLSLQTLDPGTLEAIDRSNISSDHFLEVATTLRKRFIPLQSDLMLGLPGQTAATYRDDLQIMFDLEIMPRTWPVLMLPNAPMNDPAYRAEHEIEVDHRNIVVSTSSYSEADRRDMLRFRRVYTSVEIFGLLRHVLRWLQWDHGHRAVDVISRLVHVTDDRESRRTYPLISWVVEHFDYSPVLPLGPHHFYAEVERFIRDEFPEAGVDPALRTVLDVQVHLAPAAGRSFPETLTLEHDYVEYYLGATDELYRSGHPSRPARPLGDMGPGSLEIVADPLDLCGRGQYLLGDPRDEVHQGQFYTAAEFGLELDSPLARCFTFVQRHFPAPALERLRDLRRDRLGDALLEPPATRRGSPVNLVRRPAPAV